jgi:bifunctional non-homologous end joining protein LigD
VYSRNGKDFTDRFLLIPAAVLHLPVRSAAIDGELVACDGEDKPDFYALLRRPASGLCVWCFDLLMVNGRDLRTLPLERRKAKLSALLAKTPGDTLRLSHTFRDGEKLLHAAAQNGLEGIVSKQRESVYVAGPASGWIKVKTAEWRAANRERYKLFEKT